MRDSPQARLALTAVLAAAVVAVAAIAGSARGSLAALHISTNWAGYAVITPAGRKPLAFGHVIATWRVPHVTCTAGKGSSVAVWVGIGGYKTNAPSLQQLGTSADCSPAGRASYSSWTEIVPAPAHFLRFRVVPGDRITAEVLQRGRRVTLQMRNLTRGTRFSSTVTSKAAVDRSSAEWVVEAPSLCRGANTCTVVPLSRFGSVAFNGASATAGGRAAGISATGWQTIPLALASTNGGGDLYSAASNPSGALPGTLSAGGSAFSVAYRSRLLPPSSFQFGFPRPGAPLPAWIR